MISNCPAIAADALARGVLDSADCLIASQVEQGYAGLLAPGGSLAAVLTTALVIYVAVFGYRLILGLSALSLREVVPHFVKIGIVLALATSWPGYQTLVFDTLFHGPEQVADVIVAKAAGPGMRSGDVMGAVQAVFTRLTDAAGDAWAQTTPPTVVARAAPAAAIVSAPAAVPVQYGPPQFVAALLWACALVLMATSVGVLLVVRIVLALLLLLGPLFIAFALFRPTRGLAEGWLRVTVKFALVPLFALPLIAVAVTFLAPLVAGLGNEPIAAVRDTPALLILLVVLVFAVVMVQAARLGGGIAGSIRLPRGASPAVPERSPEMPATNGPPAFARQAGNSRAETIVQAITASTRRAGPGMTPVAVAATRAIAGPVAAVPVSAGNNDRLGQGYRRLAVAPAIPRI